MEVLLDRQAEKTFVVVKGRLDTTTSNQFQQDIAPLMEGDAPDIEINCAEMNYTSSQGLRMFLMLQKSVNARHGKLVLTNMQDQVRQVFDITGFSNIITIV